DLIPTVPQPTPSVLRPPEPARPRGRFGRRLLVAAAGAVLVGLVLAAALLLPSGPSGRSGPPATDRQPPPGPGAGGATPPRPRAPAPSSTSSGGMKRVGVPKGRSLMGPPATEPKRKPNEGQHEVVITRPFYLGAYEVTQEQFRAVMGRCPSQFSREGRSKIYVQGLSDDELKRLPVENVTWAEAVEFC